LYKWRRIRNISYPRIKHGGVLTTYLHPAKYHNQAGSGSTTDPRTKIVELSAIVTAFGVTALAMLPKGF